MGSQPRPHRRGGSTVNATGTSDPPTRAVLSSTAAADHRARLVLPPPTWLEHARPTARHRYWRPAFIHSSLTPLVVDGTRAQHHPSPNLVVGVHVRALSRPGHARTIRH